MKNGRKVYKLYDIIHYSVIFDINIPNYREAQYEDN